MASIKITENKDGSSSYQVQIRRKNIDVYKSFSTKEDALLYVTYKERLIDNIHNFEVDLQDRISVSQIFELKIQNAIDVSSKEIKDIENSSKRFVDYFGKNTAINSIAYEKWKEFAEILYMSDVYRGYNSEKGKRKMSAKTLKKIFAHASSAISYAQSHGMNLENHPLKVIQTHIRPLINIEKE